MYLSFFTGIWQQEVLFILWLLFQEWETQHQVQ
jgi:hypothetical protein